MSEAVERVGDTEQRVGKDAYPSLSGNLWLYTNFDCNLNCSYCVTESTPTAPRRPLGLENVQRLVDEGIELGFGHVFFTGGEPFLLAEIYDVLAYASERIPTTVLTNWMLLHGQRLEMLRAIANGNLKVQVSLDGGSPEHHDPYRGEGTWVKTVDGIRLLLERGIRVSISTTVTPANSAYLDHLHEFRRRLGIPDEEHVVRPLARRGFSGEGLDVGRHSLVPEVTVTADGVYWHPLISPDAIDMQVTEAMFPLADAVQSIQQQLAAEGAEGVPVRETFT